MSISFTTTHDQLSVPLETIKTLHGNRPPVPALGLIRLSVSDADHATIEAFDFETSIDAAVGMDSNTGLPGQVMLNRAMFHHIVKSFAIGATKTYLARQLITVREEGGSVELSSGGYRFSMPITKDADDFPALPPRSTTTPVQVDRDAFFATATRVLVCAGADPTLPMLTGIKVFSVPGGLQLVATDRFRLGLGFVPTTGTDDAEPISALMPAKALATIARYMQPGMSLRITADDMLAWLHCGGLSVSLRLLDSEFVKYQSLIPTGSSGHHDAVVPRKDLLLAFKRAQVILDRGHHARVRIAGSKISVTAGGGEEGRMESPEFDSAQAGKDLEMIAFNAEYLGPALASFDTDHVSIRYSTPSRPILIAAPGQLDNEQAFRTLVMPARLPS